MAYIAKQKVYGNIYYYLRKSVREGKKVKTKNIAYLGKSEEEASKKAQEILNNLEKKKDSLNLIHKKISIEELANYCKRRGFVYQSAEIYGGFAGFWDFGTLGVELKNNIKKVWWDFIVKTRDDVVGIDGSIITHPKVWNASGHVESFSDIFVVCKKCKKPGKVDKAELGKVKCECGGEYDEKSAKEFKLMFDTTVGENTKSYLRPETAQLIFTNFKLVSENERLKLPFGIAQIGKAFRNEISPRDFLFRSREFEQMELQYFIDPDKLDDCEYYEKIKDEKLKILTASSQEREGKDEEFTIEEMFSKKIFKNKWHAYWLYLSYKWFINLGINKDNLRLREHRPDELSHYAKAAVDIEYNFLFGYKEIFGSHDRGQFDLESHGKATKKPMDIYDEDSKKRVNPRVIEASFGVERALMVFMFDSIYTDSTRDSILLKINPKLAPIKAAVFPIIKKEEYINIAKEIIDDLRKEFNIGYDKSGSIGRRYLRNDEIGTPVCVTVDDKTPEDKSVTLRDRDSTQQVRIKIKNLKEVMRKIIDGENLVRLGKNVNTRKK